ncbi:DUF4888 domain-containing protein, partial [Staphylococcus aureus]|nr:DUF4888 domain-containing protein [Staphylococcus aureus]
LQNGQKVSIYSSDSSSPVSGKVGAGPTTSGNGTTFKKRFIDKITID